MGGSSGASNGGPYGTLRQEADGPRPPIVVQATPSAPAGQSNLELEEMRDELLMYVGERCCWGTRPARTWAFRSVEESTSYVGTLESFVEFRKVVRRPQPFTRGDPVDGPGTNGKARPPDMWEVQADMFAPPMFVSREVSMKVPQTDAIESCKVCGGHGGVPCKGCQGKYLKGRACRTCDGNRRVRTADGESECPSCRGSGQAGCAQCSSAGLVPCAACAGEGCILVSDFVIISWMSILAERVIHADPLCSEVPQERMQRCSVRGGTEILRLEEPRLLPLEEGEHPLAELLSHQLFDSVHSTTPPGGRVVRERHVITTVPVTRAVLASGHREFSFFILGSRRSIHVKDYPPVCTAGCTSFTCGASACNVV
eukprot:TRINITY_DN9070_c0_g1_i1.p1 TRINITY_DN9070_c0_g1~~TRINITY_DN9070_c0_g1_i1.p1  ORF type:complete len:370 (+),score=45.49 TRINITY_DN9070_c0_g1_i1:199-1308(+)